MRTIETPLEYFERDSVYALMLHTGAGNTDIGIWEGNTANWDENLKSKVIIYDRFFNPIRVLQFYGSSFIRPIGSADMRMYFNGVFYTSSANPTITIPEIQWSHTPQYGTRFLLEYDLADQTLTERVSIRDSIPQNWYSNSGQPYDTYCTASGFVSNPNLKKMTLTSDLFTIASTAFYGAHTVNNVAYENTQNQMGYLSIRYQLDDQVTSVAPVGPFAESNIFDFDYFPSEDSAHYYRLGSFRGTQSPINAGGDTFAGWPTDSSYVTYLAKENAAGESQWITPLYSYNSTQSDSFPTGNLMYAQQKFRSLIEWNDRAYLSEDFSISTNALSPDTLYFRDCFGSDSAYFQMIDFIDEFGANNTRRLPYAKNLIYAVADNGDVAARLSYVNKYIGTISSGTIERYSRVFKAGDRLAWVTNYFAQSDTIIALTRTVPGNMPATTTVELPAGQGALIFWLDQDLNLLDHWNIPYTSPGYSLDGIMIGYVGMYNTDTLLIQGNINESVTTRMDPFGNAPNLYYPHSTPFLAFYGGMSPTAIKEARGLPTLNVYPNPAKNNLTVAQYSAFDRYAIFDLSGRKIQSDTFGPGATGKIDLKNLEAGMYLLRCRGASGYASAKFVIE